jgi:hypothetical protein
MKASIRLGVLVLLSVLAGWFAFKHVPPPLPELSRAEFMAEVRTGHVHKVIIEDHQVITGESSTRGPFRTDYKEPEDANLAAELRAQGVEVLFDTSAGLTP